MSGVLQRLQKLDQRVIGRPRPPAPRGASRGGATGAGRAVLAVLLLVGYYVLAAAVIGAMVWLTVAAARGGSGAISGKLGVITAIVAVAIGRAVFAVERGSDPDEYGIPATRAEQPELWALIDEVSAELEVAPPDDLWLVDDVNAFVRQDSRLLGLIGGRRHMHVGVSLMQVLTVDELRGVIAHELGHYAGGDTRLSALVYRAGSTVGRTVLNLGPTTLLGRLFGLYARLFQRVSLSVRRRQELRADEGSVRVVGQATHESALRSAQAGAPAYGFFLNSYVDPLWRAGTAPADLFAGFRALLDDPVRQEQMAEIRADEGAPADPYDSHPSLAQRVAHVRSLPDRQPPGDRRPARLLLRDPDRVEQRLTSWLNGRLLRKVPEQLYAFTSAPDPAPYVAHLPGTATALSEATAAVDGGPEPAGLGRTLALLEQDRDVELVTQLTGDRRTPGEEGRREDLRNVVAGPVASAAAAALADAGRASWRFSWSGPCELVDAKGRPLELAARLVEALEDGPQALRPLLTKLRVPLGDDALPVVVRAPEQREGVIEVWPELRRGRRWYDGLVTPDQLLVVPQPRSWRMTLLRAASAQYSIGKERRRKHARQRISALLELPVHELVRRSGVRVVKWDQLGAVELRRGLANAWVLRLPGQGKPLDKLKADDLMAPEPEQVDALLRRLVGDRLDSNV